MIVVELLGGRGCEVVEALVGSLGVEPVDPVQRLDLDVVDVAPRALLVDEFGLERADGALGQSVVECVANGPNGGVDTGVREATRSRRSKRRLGPGVLASTMWMNDLELIEALNDCTDVCVVVTKQTEKDLRKPQAQRTVRLAGMRSLWQKPFPELHEYVPGGGTPVVVGPGTEDWLEPDDENAPHIGAVREVGFRKVGGRLVPIVHSKILLLGQMWWSDDHPSGYSVDEFGFAPERLWIGSANFTGSSRGSLEMGMWTDDPALLAAARSYLLGLVLMSEPLGEGPDIMAEDLVPVQYDHKAMWEYMAELSDTTAEEDDLDEEF